MRITAFLLLVLALHVSARTFSQRITYSGKDVPLEKVFEAIEKQTGYVVFYDYRQIIGAKQVTIDAKDEQLTTFLIRCFQNQPFGFAIEDKTIMITKLPAVVGVNTNNPKNIEKPLIDVHGRVIDSATGTAMPGATVTIKGTSRATLTNEKGEFELRGVASGANIEVSYLGYQNKIVEIINGNAVTVRMIIATNKLDEAQVIAYGKTSERLSTGDVTTVRAAEISEQPVANPLLALEGRVPGLFIAQTTGFSGTGVKVQIMGQNSIGKGNDPLYVIDGVPYPSQPISNINTIQGGGGISSPSPLSFINSGDIESISVLKDADATAIYGSRAASGAILITTKRGRAGRTNVNLNLQNGIGNDTRRIKLLKREQYLSMRREAFKNDGLGAFGSADYDLNGTYDSTRSTDWQRVLLGGNAAYTDLQGDVSGGTISTQFLVGGNYHRETTVFSNNFSDQKGSMYFNFRNTSANQKFTLQFSGSYLFDGNRLPLSDLTTAALTLAPDAPSLHNPDGSLNWAPAKSGNSSWTNPLASFNYYSSVKTNNLVSSAVLGYEILPGLEAKASLGYTNLETNETYMTSTLALAPENRASATKLSEFNHTDINSWIIEPQVLFNHLIGRGRLEAVTGMTIHQDNNFGQLLLAQGFNSDQQEGDIGAASKVTGTTTAATIYKYNALFGRINYNWADQWIVNLTARRDGSSRFGSNNEFHNFGSAAAAWIFSQTKLLRKMLPLISFGKLSASYGTTGNDQIGDYKYLSVYGATNVPTTYQGVSGLLPTGLSNPYLQWEETRKMRAALNIGLVKDRVLVSAAYFRNRSSNQLLTYALPLITGFTNITRNFPATVQNSGWEFTLNTINFRTRAFNWSSAVNFTIPQNKLVAFSGLANSSYASSLIIGQPVTLLKAYRFLGTNPSTGIFQFADAHGNPTPTPNSTTDQTILENSSPRFYGGIQNSFSYRGLQLDVFVQFVKQTSSNYYGTIGYFPGVFSSSGPIGNQPSFVLARWQKPGDISVIQRFSTQPLQSGNARSSSAAWSDGSYARLKNISLSYQIPDSWKKKVHLQACRIYAQAQNLLTFTKFTGLDPETPSSFTLPPLRVITVGLQIGL